MSPPELFSNDPANTHEAMMEATYRALCTHGYANLTIQKIGEEFSKSKSLVYHHYDGKDELLLDFLEFMLDRFATEIIDTGADDPTDRLQSVIDLTITEPLSEERASFRRTMIELRAQAATDPAYREQFTRIERLFHDHIADLLREGIEQGTFRDVDPDQVASFLLTLIDGTMLRQTTTDDGAITSARRELEIYLQDRLIADQQ